MAGPATPNPSTQIRSLDDFLRFAAMAADGSTVAEMRAQTERFMPAINDAGPGPDPVVARVHERVSLGGMARGAAQGVTADVLVPRGEGPFPVLVYVHGGGFISGTSRSYRRLASRLCERGLVVVVVAYRLAPEARWPAQVHDVLAAVRWAGVHAQEYGGDATRLVMAGDSAGANIAASAAIMARVTDTGLSIRGLGLLYGIYYLPKLLADFASTPGPGYLSAPGVRLMVESYVDPADRPASFRAPTLSPMYGAAAMPPTILVCGEADPLLGQTRIMAEALKAAGVDHSQTVARGAPHGFCQVEWYPAAIPSLRKVAGFLLDRAG